MGEIQCLETLSVKRMEDYYGSSNHEEPLGGWCTLWTSDKEVEP